MQEKKVRRVSEMNLNGPQSIGNGSIASSSTSAIAGPHLLNGGLVERSSNYLNNELSFPPGGFPSLRLPLVGALNS